MPNKITDNDKAIVKDSELYYKKTKAVPKPEQNIGIDTSGQLLTNIYQAGARGEIDISSITEFTHLADNREQIYQMLDVMAEDSIIAAILETYAEDATEYNDNQQIIWAESDNPDIGKYITFLLDTLRIDKNIYSWVFSLLKYGDLYIQLFRQSDFEKAEALFKSFAEEEDQQYIEDKKALNEDIKVNAYKKNDNYVHYIEAVTNPAEMFELTKFGKTVGYIKSNVTNSLEKTDNYISPRLKYKFKKSDIHIFDATKFVHASLEDTSTRTTEEVTLFLDNESTDSDPGVSYTVKRGQSLLYNSFKIWRELSLMENSLLLNRITKSAITRLINVEVGDMPKEMVGPHLQGIKSLIEQKAAINAGNSMTEYTNPGPIENNIYVPTHDGKGAISASTIGGDVDVKQLYDLEYFQNKYFGSMRIPKQYFGLTDDGAGFNGGTSLAIISSRYAKAIKRIQNTVIQAITDLINLILIDKNLGTYINQFTLKMQPPTTQEEIDRRENKRESIGIMNDIMNALADIENPVTKLKIEKALISNNITDSTIIELIQDEIDRLEQEENNNVNNDNLDDFGDNDFGGGFGGSSGGSSSFDGLDEPLDLDSELGIDSEIENDLDLDTDTSSSGGADDLPSPADLGLDMTDNSNPDFN